MTVAWFVEYEREDSEEWDTLCFTLMDPEIIESDGRRIHRMYKGLRHDRFIPNVQTMDEVYTGLGLRYIEIEKPAYEFELWVEIESEPVTTEQAVEHVMATAVIEHLGPMRKTPSGAVTMAPVKPVGSEVLIDALMPFAQLGEQLRGQPFRDYETYPGSISVGWLRNAARALGRDA